MGNRQGFIKPHSDKVALTQRLFDSLVIAITHYAVVSFLRPGHWSVYHEFATVSAIVIFYISGEMIQLYRTWRAAHIGSEAKKVWQAWGLTVMSILFLAFMFKVTSYGSRVASFTWFISAPVMLCLGRMAVRTLLRSFRAQGRNTRTVAIIGATKVGNALARRIIDTRSLGLDIVGFFDDRSDADRIHEMPEELGSVRGNSEDLVARAKAGEIDVIYIALPLRAEARIQELVYQLADTTASVHVVADFFVFDLLNAQWSDVQGIPVVSIFESPFYGVDGWLKRFQDVIVGSIIMSIITIPMAVIAAGIKLTSKGPVFFKQHRYGLNGQKIRMLKFRSMTVCEDGPTIAQASKNDARITPFGAFLRKTSLDELPQFLQVITGEMSIVGPRPHAVAHNEEYRRLIHGYMLRHKVKPGITGWAQINGWRGETDTLDKMVKRVEHDLEYIQNWSLFLDLKIIFKTVVSGFAARNAY